jgi:hypothetical protein
MGNGLSQYNDGTTFDVTLPVNKYIKEWALDNYSNTKNANLSNDLGFNTIGNSIVGNTNNNNLYKNLLLKRACCTNNNNIPIPIVGSFQNSKITGKLDYSNVSGINQVTPITIPMTEAILPADANKSQVHLDIDNNNNPIMATYALNIPVFPDKQSINNNTCKLIKSDGQLDSYLYDIGSKDLNTITTAGCQTCNNLYTHFADDLFNIRQNNYGNGPTGDTPTSDPNLQILQAYGPIAGNDPKKTNQYNAFTDLNCKNSIFQRYKNTYSSGIQNFDGEQYAQNLDKYCFQNGNLLTNYNKINKIKSGLCIKNVNINNGIDYDKGAISKVLNINNICGGGTTTSADSNTVSTSNNNIYIYCCIFCCCCCCIILIMLLFLQNQ